VSEAIHASCVLLGEKGVLIRGAPGAGKSFLAGALVTRSRDLGRFAVLVGDDRLLVERRGGRLVARPHPAIAGLREVRGLGLVRQDFAVGCVVAAVVDLASGPVERLPEAAIRPCVIAGVELPSITFLLTPAIVDGVETFLKHSYLR